MNSACNWKSLAAAQAPATTVLFVDESATLNDGYFAYGGQNAGDVPSWIHNEGANFAFLDGHCKWLKRSQLTNANFAF